MKHSILFTTALILFSINSANAMSPARTKMLVSPDALYAKMFNAIQTGDWQKLTQAAKLLEPLSLEVDRKWNSNLTEQLTKSIETKNKETAKSALLSITIGGVETLLSVLGDVSSVRAKDMIKQAFTEFLQIETYLKDVNPNLTAIIMTDFRVTNASLSDKTKYNSNIKDIRNHLRQINEAF